MVQNFAQAARDALSIGGLRVGRERLRLLVEAEAAEVTRRREEGRLSPDWSAEGRRLYVGRP